MKKIINYNIDKIISGINKTADLLCPTLGPNGTHVVVGRPYQSPIVANDSGTISDNIYFDDESEQLAADIIKEATRTADNTTKDGRTSTVAILRNLVNTLHSKTLGLSQEKPRKLQKIVRDELQQALELLQKERKIVKTIKDVKNVALASSQDEELSDLISKTFWEIGKNGVIVIEDNFNPEITITKKTGMEIPFTVVSDFLSNELENAPILITTTKIESINQIKDIYGQIVNLKTYKWVIICPGFEEGVISEFKGLKGSFEILPIKIPESNKDIYEDISAITGAKLYNGQLELLNISDLGNVVSIKSKEKTIIVGNTDPVEHIKKITSKEIDSYYDKEKIEERVAKLKNGIVTLKIGSKLEQDKEFKKLKARDCINSVKTAMNDGYVIGGGVALNNVANKMKDSLIAESLRQPYKIIQESFGQPTEIPNTVLDSYKTVEQELITACVLASNIIASHGSIADKNEEDGNNINI